MAENGRVIFDGATVKKRVVKVESPEQLEQKLEEFPCAGCKRVLGLVAISDGMVVIKCKRCKAWNVLDIHLQVEDNAVVKVG